MKQKKAPFVHILWHNSLLYNVPFVEGINSSGFFDKNEHVFLTPDKNIYDKLQKYDNVFFVDRSDLTIKEASKWGEWVIVHALNSRGKDFLMTPKSILRRTIVRTWGHDINSKFDAKRTGIKSFVVKCVYRFKLRRLYMICGANKIDRANVIKHIGNICFGVFPYFGMDNNSLIEIDSKDTRQSAKNECRVMVGHSGLPEDFHMDVLKMLRKSPDHEKITVFLQLLYGNFQYMNEVKDYAMCNFNGCEVLESRLPMPEYIKLLSKVDVMVLPQIGSTSLGTFALARDLKIPIVLNKKGLYYEEFLKDGMELATLEDLENMSLDEVIRKSARYSDKLIDIFGSKQTEEDVYLVQQKFFDQLKSELKIAQGKKAKKHSAEVCDL